MNGSHSTDPTVSLYFPNVGSYVVHLNVTDRSGGMAERNWTVVVGYPFPFAAVEIVIGGAAVGLLVAVVVTLIGGPRSRRPRLFRPRLASDGSPVW